MSDRAAAGFDVFLSHSSSDRQWVRQLSEALESLGLSAFSDQRDIRPAENFVLSISDALRKSRFLVLVVLFGFNQLTKRALDLDADRAELTRDVHTLHAF